VPPGGHDRYRRSAVARRTYRFLLTPKWIAFTVATLAAIALCLTAANWQWNRLHERRTANKVVTEKQALPAVPLAEAIPLDAPLDQGKDAQWTIVTATGTYDPGSEVLIRNRSYDGASGVHVITPLRLADGSGSVLVNRGWLPNPPDPADPVIPPKPLAGQVTVEGRVRATQVRGRFGDSDPTTGTLRDLARVDIERLRQQIPYPVAPVYVELIAQQPPDPVGPTPVRPPALDDGPHLSYTGQWLLFALMAVVGWVVVVRRHAARQRKQAARDAAVQSAIAARTARDIPLRNVKPVRRADQPGADVAAAEARPPAPPLDDAASEVDEDVEPPDSPPPIDPLLRPAAQAPIDPSAAEPDPKPARVPRRQPPPHPPGDVDEEPAHD
jgi:surfeit locus 1 family protein